MMDDDVEIPDDVEIRMLEDDGYHTCRVCGRDCVPEDIGTDGTGVRIAFVCPEHGLHSVVDPFGHLR